MTDPSLDVASTSSILWIGEAEPAAAVAAAGSKMGRLADLLQAGVTVPAGFAVTVDAYRTHCAESGLDDEVGRVLAGLGDDPEPADVEAASDRIRRAFEQRELSPALSAEVTEAYERLCLECMDIDVPTAVRSSAAGEDSADASFAGIFDTYLGVSGPEQVLSAVRSCWASLFTARALSYRLRRGISHRDMPIAVGVVELVAARASGVAFSVHPVTGRPDRIVIESNWGWGEAVVQGLVTPDHVEVGKSDNRILRHDVNRKTVVSAFDHAQGRVVEREMPGSLVERQVLDEEQALAVAEAVRSIEEHYGYPVDVEWVLDRHRRSGEPVCIVQSRPVTVAAEPEPAPTGWDPVAMATKYAFHGKG